MHQCLLHIEAKLKELQSEQTIAESPQEASPLRLLLLLLPIMTKDGKNYCVN
ncbi:MAG: hypothetical protein H0U27_06280 [Nitrosopumilus sp.]|nr:hypothetical protein [Nitrosopumilus sp.]